MPEELQPEDYMLKLSIIDCYVDGAFSGGSCNWAWAAIKNDKVLHQGSGRLNGHICGMQQIGGELKAVIESVEYSKRFGCKCRIFYDYSGIFQWVSDMFDSTKTPWNTKKIWTMQYRNYIASNRQYIHEFVKVTAHSNNRWNDYVDVLARDPS